MLSKVHWMTHYGLLQPGFVCCHKADSELSLFAVVVSATASAAAADSQMARTSIGAAALIQQ